MAFVLTEFDAGIEVIVLNRPEIMNAWHEPMRREFTDALVAAEKNDQVAAVVVTGAGERAFCAGQDLNEAKDFEGHDSESWIGQWRQMYDAIRSLSKPLVIALNGVAAGSAFQVALLGDVRVGHGGSRMGQPEILSGLASITGPWIMQTSIGISRATELVLTGRIMDGEECHRIGLIHHLVESDQVLEKAKAVASDLATLPQGAMRETKAWLRQITEPGLQAALDHAVKAHAQTFGSNETKERVQGFLDQ